MENTNIVQYIFSLTTIELKQFQLWLQSDLNNSRAELLELLDWISGFRNKADLSEMTKTAAFAAIFPTQMYDDKQIRYAMSFLLQQVRAFLTWKMLQADEMQQNVYLLATLRQRKLDKPFEQELKKMYQYLDNQSNRNSDYYFNQYKIQIEQYEFLQTQSRVKAMPFKEISEDFTIYTITNTLRWQCNILTYKSIAQADYDVQFFEKVLELLKNGLFHHIPTVQIYFKIYQALTTTKIEFYNDLKQLINQHFQAFPPHEMRDIILLAINFCIKKLNGGESEFLKEIFDWYKKGFEEKVLIKNGELSRFTYNNVMIAGLKLKEYDWTKQFMESHKKYIDKTHQHDTYHFNLALWYQYQNQFDEVLELLLKVDFKDVLHALHAKQLMLKIYYQIGAFKALESLLGSIKVYLHRHKQLGYHRQDYLKLIRYTKKLIELNPHDRTAKARLRQAIENEKSLLDKRWFLEMIGE